MDTIPETLTLEAIDRRRPGRKEVDPSLIPLLRYAADGPTAIKVMRDALQAPAELSVAEVPDDGGAMLPSDGLCVLRYPY